MAPDIVRLTAAINRLPARDARLLAALAAAFGGGESGADLMWDAAQQLREETGRTAFDPERDDLARRMTQHMASAALRIFRRRLGFLPAPLARIETVPEAQLADDDHAQIARMGPVIGAADALWKNPVSVRLFLTTPHALLGGKMPVEVADCDAGRDMVLNLIQDIAHGQPL
jgi:hypothetical protein